MIPKPTPPRQIAVHTRRYSAAKIADATHALLDEIISLMRLRDLFGQHDRELAEAISQTSKAISACERAQAALEGRLHDTEHPGPIPFEPGEVPTWVRMLVAERYHPDIGWAEDFRGALDATGYDFGWLANWGTGMLDGDDVLIAEPHRIHPAATYSAWCFSQHIFADLVVDYNRWTPGDGPRIVVRNMPPKRVTDDDEIDEGDFPW